MAEDRITFRLGTQRHEDKLLRSFLAKFPQDRWNNLIKQIALSAIELHGVDWNPFVTGFVTTTPVGIPTPIPTEGVEVPVASITKKVEKPGISTLQKDLDNVVIKPAPSGTKSLADILDQ